MVLGNIYYDPIHDDTVKIFRINKMGVIVLGIDSNKEYTKLILYKHDSSKRLQNVKIN